MDDLHALLSTALLGTEEDFNSVAQDLAESEQDEILALLSTLTAYCIGLIRVVARIRGETPEDIYRRYLARAIEAQVDD